MMGTKQTTFYSFNTPFGLLMAGCFILASYLCYVNTGSIFTNLVLDRTFTFLYILGLFIQIRRYRESPLKNGYTTYGSALLAGIWISLTVSFIYCIYTILLYSCHPSLVTNYLTTVQTAWRELHGQSPATESMLQLFSLYTSPLSIGLSELFTKFFVGFFYTLIIAAILRKPRPITPTDQNSSFQP